jgi:hypothetical protein
MHLGPNNDTSHNVPRSFFHSHASRQRRRITIVVSIGLVPTAETIELVTFAAAQVRETVADATTEMQSTGREI